MQGFPQGPSEAYRRWKRRQRLLLLLLGVLLVLEVALLTRGIMLLPPSGAAALAPSPTPTLTPTPSPTPRPTPPAPAITSVAGVLLDMSNGGILFAKNGDEELPMASTTKIMTAVLALENGNLDQEVTIGADALRLPSDASRMGVKLGEVFTMHDLLYGLLLPSGDDVAVAIADAVSKDRKANFIDLMNQQAQYLGLTHTHYVNPDGLDADGHYTSVDDLVHLTRFALRLPLFAKIVATYEYIVPATDKHDRYDLKNTNQLLWPKIGYPGADGIKTGTTGKAGACLVFSAVRNGHHLLGAVLGAPVDEARYKDAYVLLDWGFSVVAAS